MNILWIPHSPSEPGAHRRDQYFIERLKDRHNIVTLTWETWSTGGRLKAYFEGMQFYKLDEVAGQTCYHVRRIPDFLKPFRKQDYDTVNINEKFFREDILKVIALENIDMVVAGPSSFMTGYPPFDLSIPFVFDYLDCADWEARPDHPEITYVREADAVLSVSSIAQERAEKFGKPAMLLPNGADVARFQQADGAAVRKKLGLEDAQVVSLIGLTCSPRLYFLDSIREARKTLPNLKCLLVGKSDAIEARLADMPDADDLFVYTGPVPYEEIASYFAASDVGMYPVDEAIYYDAASPIKLFEYTAAGKPVVVPRIREAVRMGFSNFVFAGPDAKPYAEGIVDAFNNPPAVTPGEVDPYDWQHLTDELDSFLKKVQVDFQSGKLSQRAATSLEAES